jgi:hypothetical protein
MAAVLRRVIAARTTFINIEFPIYIAVLDLSRATSLTITEEIPISARMMVIEANAMAKESRPYLSVPR